MRLYHYVKADVIEKGLNADGFWVKASRPCEFNDLFECTGGVYGNPTRSLVEDFCATRHDQAMVASAHGDTAEYVGKWLWKAFIDRKFLGQGYRISCFTDAGRMQKYPGSDIRMWAHYTNQGMGVRFKIDTEKMQFLPEAVRYSCEAPKLDLSTVNHIRELTDFIEDCIITKHKIWEPEQEARIIFRGSNEAVCFDPKVKMHRWLLPLNCVVKIAIGEALLKSSEIYVILQHIRNVIRRVRPTISIVAATRNYNTYDIDYVPITEFQSK